MLSKIEMVEIDINGYKNLIFNSSKNKTKVYKFYLNEIVKPAVWLRRGKGGDRYLFIIWWNLLLNRNEWFPQLENYSTDSAFFLQQLYKWTA